MAKDDDGEEQWAADCMQTALPGVRVEVDDDNSAPSMHDLNLWRGESLVGAAEGHHRDGSGLHRTVEPGQW